MKNAAIYTAGTLVAGTCNYLFNFVTSHHLSISEYGELQSLMALFTIAAVFTTGINYFAIKYSSAFSYAGDVASGRHFLHWLRPHVYKLGGALLVLFLLATPLVYSYLHLDSYFSIVVVFLSVVLAIWASAATGLLNGWQAFALVNVLAVVSAGLKLLVGGVIVLYFPDGSAVVVALLAAGIIGWGLAEILVIRKLGRHQTKPGHDWEKKYFSNVNIKSTVLPILAFSSLVVLLSNIDVLLVKNLTNPEITGFYGALKVLGTVVISVNMAVIAVILPHASGLAHAGERISRSLLLNAYVWILALGGVATTLYWLIPKFLVGLLFGAKYAIVSGSLWLFGLMAVTLSILLLEAHIAYAQHNLKVSYILGAVVLGMGAGIYWFHDSVFQIALTLTVVLFIGYLCALVINYLPKLPRVSP
jgi:O-antigen/teichoic acid export membrane protein